MPRSSTRPARRWGRLAGAVTAVALLATGCGSDVDEADARGSEAAADLAGETGDAGGRGGNVHEFSGASALDDPEDESFPDPLINLDDLLSGGPPPDGIPSIDEPSFDPAAEVEWLEDDEPLLSLTVGEETRGYPLGILTWHEIVNDTIGGTPVAVTYCPLCNSGVAFERTVDGEVTTFGVSGRLYADNLVMFDRATESLWPQLTGTASVGARTGTQLESIPMGTVGWAQFRAEHPDALVLNRDTGHERDYGNNPYVGYDEDVNSEPIFPLPGASDPRLPPKERVVGVGAGDNAIAVRRTDLADAGVTRVQVGADPVTLWHLPGQVTALGGREIADGREIGTVAAFDPRVGAQELEFVADDGVITDRGTGSQWSVFGRAVAGSLEGEILAPVVHLDTFWFAWVAFQPATTLLGE